MSRKVSPSWFALLYLALLLLAASLLQKPLKREMNRLQQKRQAVKQMATMLRAEQWDLERLEKTIADGDATPPADLIPVHFPEGAVTLLDADPRSISPDWSFKRQSIEFTQANWSSLTGLLDDLAAQSPSWQPYLVDLKVEEGLVTGRVGVESLDKVDSGN